MEPGNLKTIPDRASLPLFVTGILLMIAGVLPLVALLGMLLGVLPRNDTVHPAGAILSAAFCLATGLPGLFAFVLRRRKYAARLGRIAGGLLLLYGLFFPVSLLAGTPFFIPLGLYLFAATGIWALLKSKS